MIATHGSWTFKRIGTTAVFIRRRKLKSENGENERDKPGSIVCSFFFAGFECFGFHANGWEAYIMYSIARKRIATDSKKIGYHQCKREDEELRHLWSNPCRSEDARDEKA